MQDDRVVAGSARLQAVFQRGLLVSLVDHRTGDELLMSGTAASPAVRALPPTGTKQTPPVRVSISGDRKTATFASIRQAEECRWTVRFSETDDGLVMRAECARKNGGIEAGELAVPEPDWKRWQLALPCGAQGLALRGPQPGSINAFRYCGHRQWEAQLAVFEPRPDLLLGKRPKSGWAVWAEDRDFIPKRIAVDRSGTGGIIRLITDTEGDPTTVHRASSVSWHIDVFEGDWHGPAARYRAWMQQAFRPSGWQPPEWTRRIGAFVKVSRLHPELLAALAERLDPRRTLLVLPNWRKSGYDRNYPDYTPAPGFAAFCREAHRLGFRVMVHFSTFGCSPTNPAFAKLKPFLLRDRAGKPQGWRLDPPDNPQRHFEIHPGCSAYRRILVDSARTVRQHYGVDAFHLDVSMQLTNPRTGRVEGLNVGQGKRRLFEELARAVPGAAFGGEELNESAFGIFSFAQRTPFDNAARRDHPIGVFLFGNQVKYYSHYSRTLAGTASNTQTADFLRTGEPAGLYPTFGASAPDDLTSPCAGILCSIGRVFQRFGLIPAVDRPWPSGVRFCWEEQTKEKRRWFVRGDADSARLACGVRTAWLRRSGLGAIGPEWSVPGWPVGDANGTSGLNPILPYVLLPGRPFAGTPRFLRLDPDLVLNRYELTPEVIRAEVLPNRRRTAVVVLTDRADAMRTGLLVADPKQREASFGNGAVFEQRYVSSGGSALPGFAAHPPWKNLSAGHGAVFAEFPVDLPEPGKAGKGLLLDWVAGMLDPSRGSDGVTVEVEVDRHRIFSQHVAGKGWRPMHCDLSAFAGKTIALRLITTPGPAGNTTWDLCGWGDPIIRRGRVHGELRIQCSRPPLAVSDAAGRSLGFKHIGGTALSVSLPAPGRVTVRCVPGVPVPQVPCDLVDLPHRTGQIVAGDGWYEVPATSEIGKRRDRSCGGAVRRNAVSAHPPQYGRTVLQWLLNLPVRSTLRLDLGYGISGNFSKGVSFQVHVDGRSIWRDDMTVCGHRTASVALAEFAGRDIVLDLVSDSMGPADFDWALWSRIRLVAGP